MWLLNLGTIEIDANYVLAGHPNAGSASNPNPKHERIDLVLIAVLIEHPKEGLILFETGCHDDMEEQWGPMYDVSPRKNYTAHNTLPEQIAATGHDIRDVKAVLMGHLRNTHDRGFDSVVYWLIVHVLDADHSGGLMHFIDTNVPIYVHDEELHTALWSLFTKADRGPYQASYLTPRLNWQTFDGKVSEIFEGISMHHCPGHTAGLCCMQVDLKDEGTFVFTGDQFHVKENYTRRQPQGFLGRDRTTWLQSLTYIERLERLLNAKIVYGHDAGCFYEMKQLPQFYT
ncbi:hypothetical protein CLAIMM_13308 [Cladophialophora immunda]|nr:hypothetical protein CLAIMM_13308 [Cladophialophora immunda]